jgi:3-deoxy-D-arabino-heptulosonate 7-phosphate (DAHP) synthase
MAGYMGFILGISTVLAHRKPQPPCRQAAICGGNGSSATLQPPPATAKPDARQEIKPKTSFRIFRRLTAIRDAPNT